MCHFIWLYIFVLFLCFSFPCFYVVKALQAVILSCFCISYLFIHVYCMIFHVNAINKYTIHYYADISSQTQLKWWVLTSSNIIKWCFHDDDRGTLVENGLTCLHFLVNTLLLWNKRKKSMGCEIWNTILDVKQSYLRSNSISESMFSAAVCSSSQPMCTRPRDSSRVYHDKCSNDSYK